MFSRVTRVRLEVSPPVIRFRSLGFPLGCVAESVTSVSMGSVRGREGRRKSWKISPGERKGTTKRERKRKVKEAARWKSIPWRDVDNPVPCQNTLRFFCLLTSFPLPPSRSRPFIPVYSRRSLLFVLFSYSSFLFFPYPSFAAPFYSSPPATSYPRCGHREP